MKTISRPLDYEKRLDRARNHAGDGAEAMQDAKGLLASLRKDILGRRSQQELLDHTTDAMVAADHVRVTKERLEQVVKSAKATKADAGAIADEAEHLLWGIDAHYADLLAGQVDLGPVITEPPKPKRKKAGPAEETIVAEEPAAAPPLRMPRGLGFAAGLLEEIDAELGSDGPPLDLEELGYRLAKRAGEGCVSEIGDMIIAAAEDSDHPPALTDAERAAFAAGVKRAEAEDEAQDGPHAAPGQEQGAAPLRAPKDVPGIDLALLERYDSPPTLRELARVLTQEHYVIGDTVDSVFSTLVDALLPEAGVAAVLVLMEAEQAEVRAGVAEAIAAEEAKARGECAARSSTGDVCELTPGHDGWHKRAAVTWLSEQAIRAAQAPGPLVQQTADAVLQRFLARAREIGKADGARKPGKPGLHSRDRFDSAAELWDSPIFGPPAELAPSKAVLFVAYEESYEAAKKAPKRGRKPRAEQGGGAS